MSDYETIDYIFILILLLSTLFGMARGFVREFFTLLNVTLALLFTFYFFPNSYDFFAKQFTNNTMIVACAGFGVFFVSWIIIAIINSYLIDSLGSIKGSGFDRLLGTAFGLLRGALIIIAIYLGIVMGYKAQDDEKNLPEWMLHAKTYGLVKMQAKYFVEMMPDRFQQIYRSGTEHMMTNVVESVSPHGLLSDEERKMLDYGLTTKNTDTLRQIIHAMPPTLGRSMDFYDLGKLDRKEFKIYVQDLISDYDYALRDNRIKPTIPAKNVESLKKSVEAIEEVQQDLYKGGVY